MRSLLRIVAGLLVADMLRVVVTTSLGDGQTCCPAFVQVIAALAALAFIIKIVIDNTLHYHEVDWAHHSQAYWLRWLLVGMDLASYSLCYATVALFVSAREAGTLQPRVLLISSGMFATVELLHWLWCDRAVALARDADVPNTDPRLQALNVWRWLSCACTVLGAITFSALTALIDCPAASSCAPALFITYCAIVVTAYVFVRRREYLRRRTM